MLFQIKDIYKFRAETKEWHCSKPPSEYTTVLELNAQVILGDRDNRGRRVYVVKVGERVFVCQKETVWGHLGRSNVLLNQQTE
jgi:hypothetical protein